MSSIRPTSLILYKQLIRECRKFTLYNYREYFTRRIRDEFRQNRDLQDASKIGALLKKGQENLEMLRRQTTIGNLYTPFQRSIIEKQQHPITATR